MTEIEAIIRNEILRDGIISVARFMRLALYHPGAGYYRRDRTPFGPTGDFYTAEQLQPVFGEVIAAYAAKLAKSTALGDEFSVLEIGAGRADLRTVLAPWNYRGFDWTGDSLPVQIRGLVLANEFFDALPTHLLVKEEARWCEWGVTDRDGKLATAAMPNTDPELAGYAHRYGASLPDGSQLEACLDAAAWLQILSRIHMEGVLLVIDYGYSENELARLAAGTMMTYRNHFASADFLSHPGERDLTSHVNFSYLKELALRSGYRIEADQSLRSWLHRVWDEKDFKALWQHRDERWKLRWKQLFVGMGETFRVLELGKCRRES